MGIFLVNYDYSTIQHIVQAMLPFQLEDRDRHPEDGFNSSRFSYCIMFG